MPGGVGVVEGLLLLSLLLSSSIYTRQTSGCGPSGGGIIFARAGLPVIFVGARKRVVSQRGQVATGVGVVSGKRNRLGCVSAVTRPSRGTSCAKCVSLGCHNGSSFAGSSGGPCTVHTLSGPLRSNNGGRGISVLNVNGSGS